MRISDLSSDVCSSDLYERQCFVVQGNSAVAGIPVGGALVFGVDDQHNPADLGRDANASAPDRAQELTPESFPLHTHIRSEEHTSELQSLMRTSYAVFCLKKKQT